MKQQNDQTCILYVSQLKRTHTKSPYTSTAIISRSSFFSPISVVVSMRLEIDFQSQCCFKSAINRTEPRCAENRFYNNVTVLKVCLSTYPECTSDNWLPVPTVKPHN